MKVIAVANQKGGIGKTTTALGLASVLMNKGYKVLFIDTDKQCNSSDTYRAKTNNTTTLYDVILENRKHRTPIKEAIQHTEIGDIVPGDQLLRDADRILQPQIDGLLILKEALRELDDDEYDFVIIDTPPNNNTMLQSSLVAADEVIIPTQADRYSIIGLSDIDATIKAIQKRLNPNLKVAGILPIMFAGRQNLDKETKEALKTVSTLMNTKIFDTNIRKCQKTKEAQARRMLLLDYNAKCNAALDYIAFTEEFLGENKEESLGEDKDDRV